MSNNANAMVLASFAGDVLALGVHWIYDPARIAREFGRVDSYLKPRSDSYHPTRESGEFTHYGDQTMVLLESLAAKGGFDLDDFAGRWRTLFKNYSGYIDGATKGTLKNFEAGRGPEESGSSSNDLAGASRIAPLVLWLRNDPEKLARAARGQTAMTHADSDTVHAAEFFARAARRVLEGTSPVSAMTDEAQGRFAGTRIEHLVSEGVKSKTQETVPVIGRFGRSCHAPEAFPAVVHLIARYERNLEEALIENVMSGGDSAARGMLAGMILGAHLGMEGIPERWVSEMKKKREIEKALEKYKCGDAT